MQNYSISLELVLIIIETIVLTILILHIRGLKKTTAELHNVVSEMHTTHKELHKDTKVIKQATEHLLDNKLKK